jgi:Protein of unknown function (DUF1257)
MAIDENGAGNRELLEALPTAIMSPQGSRSSIVRQFNTAEEETLARLTAGILTTSSPLFMGWTFINLNHQPKGNMSHFTEIKTQIKDIDALRQACQEMGLPLLQDAESRGYYENKTKGDYVIQLKGPYDIALNKQPDGTFGLTADLWQGHVEKEVGQKYVKLLQLYGVHKATIEARKKGISVLRRQQNNGTIKLVLMGV